MAEAVDFDLGTLAKYPRQNAIFRWVTNRPNELRLYNWPEHIRWEAAVFLSTPGFSREWLKYNLGSGWDHRVIVKLRNWYDADMVKIGQQNANTATYDDATRFVQRHPNPKHLKLPPWAAPFFFDDIKNGMTQREQKLVWGGRHKGFRRKGIIL